MKKRYLAAQIALALAGTFLLSSCSDSGDSYIPPMPASGTATVQPAGTGTQPSTTDTKGTAQPSTGDQGQQQGTGQQKGKGSEGSQTPAPSSGSSTNPKTDKPSTPGASSSSQTEKSSTPKEGTQTKGDSSSTGGSSAPSGASGKKSNPAHTDAGNTGTGSSAQSGGESSGGKTSSQGSGKSTASTSSSTSSGQQGASSSGSSAGSQSEPSSPTKPPVQLPKPPAIQHDQFFSDTPFQGESLNEQEQKTVAKAWTSAEFTRIATPGNNALGATENAVGLMNDRSAQRVADLTNEAGKVLLVDQNPTGLSNFNPYKSPRVHFYYLNKDEGTQLNEDGSLKNPTPPDPLKYERYFDYYADTQNWSPITHADQIFDKMMAPISPFLGELFASNGGLSSVSGDPYAGFMSQGGEVDFLGYQEGKIGSVDKLLDVLQSGIFKDRVKAGYNIVNLSWGIVKSQHDFEKDTLALTTTTKILDIFNQLAKDNDLMVIQAAGNSSDLENTGKAYLIHDDEMKKTFKYKDFEDSWILVAGYKNTRQALLYAYQHSNTCALDSAHCLVAYAQVKYSFNLPENQQNGTFSTPDATINNSLWLPEWGTSFAAPYVASVAAAVRSVYPFFSNQNLQTTLLTTAAYLNDDAEIGHQPGANQKPYNDQSGWGLVQPQSAVNGPKQFYDRDFVADMSHNESYMHQVGQVFNFNNNISGSHGLTVKGNSLHDVLSLNGTNTYSGGTKLQSGAILNVDGVSPDSTITIDTNSALYGHGEVGKVTNKGQVHAYSYLARDQYQMPQLIAEKDAKNIPFNNQGLLVKGDYTQNNGGALYVRLGQPLEVTQDVKFEGGTLVVDGIASAILTNDGYVYGPVVLSKKSISGEDKLKLTTSAPLLDLQYTPTAFQYSISGMSGLAVKAKIITYTTAASEGRFGGDTSSEAQRAVLVNGARNLDNLSHEEARAANVQGTLSALDMQSDLQSRLHNTPDNTLFSRQSHSQPLLSGIETVPAGPLTWQSAQKVQGLVSDNAKILLVEKLPANVTIGEIPTGRFQQVYYSSDNTQVEAPNPKDYEKPQYYSPASVKYELPFHRSDFILHKIFYDGMEEANPGLFGQHGKVKLISLPYYQVSGGHRDYWPILSSGTLNKAVEAGYNILPLNWGFYFDIAGLYSQYCFGDNKKKTCTDSQSYVKKVNQLVSEIKTTTRDIDTPYALSRAIAAIVPGLNQEVMDNENNAFKNLDQLAENNDLTLILDAGNGNQLTASVTAAIISYGNNNETPLYPALRNSFIVAALYQPIYFNRKLSNLRYPQMYANTCSATPLYCVEAPGYVTISFDPSMPNAHYMTENANKFLPESTPESQKMFVHQQWFDINSYAAEGFATSYVATEVGLLRSVFPFFTNQNIQTTVLTTALPVGQVPQKNPLDNRVDPVHGWGEVQPQTAINGPEDFYFRDFVVDFTHNQSTWKKKGITPVYTFSNDISATTEQNSTPHGLTVTGSGAVLSLTGTDHYKGATTVSNGAILNVDGVLTDSVVTVDKDSSLYGSGEVKSVNNAGNLYAYSYHDRVNASELVGQGIGKNQPYNGKGLYIAGDLTNNGTLHVKMGQPLEVGGTATINGTLDVDGVAMGLVAQGDVVYGTVVLSPNMIQHDSMKLEITAPLLSSTDATVEDLTLQKDKQIHALVVKTKYQPITTALDKRDLKSRSSHQSVLYGGAENLDTAHNMALRNPRRTPLYHLLARLQSANSAQLTAFANMFSAASFDQIRQFLREIGDLEQNQSLFASLIPAHLGLQVTDSNTAFIGSDGVLGEFIQVYAQLHQAKQSFALGLVQSASRYHNVMNSARTDTTHEWGVNLQWQESLGALDVNTTLSYGLHNNNMNRAQVSLAQGSTSMTDHYISQTLDTRLIVDYPWMLNAHHLLTPYIGAAYQFYGLHSLDEKHPEFVLHVPAQWHLQTEAMAGFVYEYHQSLSVGMLSVQADMGLNIPLQKESPLWGSIDDAGVQILQHFATLPTHVLWENEVQVRYQWGQTSVSAHASVIKGAHWMGGAGLDLQYQF